MMVQTPVALLAEGVDRNAPEYDEHAFGDRSPSSRRAWIEIGWNRPLLCPGPVALLAEGVDRNKFGVIDLFDHKMSPSSRRAWIEIRKTLFLTGSTQSPSSRRAWIEIEIVLPSFERMDGRPPRGGRG